MTNGKLDLEAKRLLFDTLKSVKGEDLTELVTSILSSAEIKDISRRIYVAKLLKKNYTYTQIAGMLGMSESTVNKIHFKTKGSPTINTLFYQK